MCTKLCLESLNGRDHSGRPRHIWNKLKWILEKQGVAQNRNWWQALVNMVMENLI
jgi:hypothetical protein